MVEVISAADFVARVKRGEACCVLDVRTGAEYREARLRGACHHMPLDQLDVAQCKTLAQDPQKPFYLLCKGGMRARRAAEILQQAGLGQGVVVEGGLDGCMACGAEIVRGEKNVLPLERQVRVAAGLMVLLGVGLGALVHPGFYGLAAFVGAGLVFAGLSGWCGMAMLLAKAPWNR